MVTSVLLSREDRRVLGEIKMFLGDRWAQFEEQQTEVGEEPIHEDQFENLMDRLIGSAG